MGAANRDVCKLNVQIHPCLKRDINSNKGLEKAKRGTFLFFLLGQLKKGGSVLER
jgi:hypothetical protein